MVINAERTMDKEMSAESHAQLESVCKNQESSSSEEEDDVQPVVNMPPTHFSNINVQNSANVHFGTSAVYNGDVTVIVSPGVNGQVSASSVKRVQTKNENVLVTSGERNNLNVDEKKNLAFMTAGILNYSEVHQTFNEKTAHLSKKSKFSSKMASFGFLVVIIIGLIIALAIVWSLRLSSSNSSDYYPDYEKASDFINGTEGSAPYYSRIDWLAQPVLEYDPMKLPVSFYIISHSATNPCFNHSQCVLQMRQMQMYHIESYGWGDIGYNFAVGGNGGIYEGRGWNKVGAHAKGYNHLSIGINLIGTFIKVLPTNAQMKSLRILLEEGVRLGKVTPDYKLIGHKQVSLTESPGSKFMEELQKWPHWTPYADHPLPIGR